MASRSTQAADDPTYDLLGRQRAEGPAVGAGRRVVAVEDQISLAVDLGHALHEAHVAPIGVLAEDHVADPRRSAPKGPGVDQDLLAGLVQLCNVRCEVLQPGSIEATIPVNQQRRSYFYDEAIERIELGARHQTASTSKAMVPRV